MQIVFHRELLSVQVTGIYDRNKAIYGGINMRIALSFNTSTITAGVAMRWRIFF